MNALADMRDFDPANDYEVMHGAADEVLDDTPHSMEAEQALLGVILFDNEVFTKVRPILQARYFYSPVHVTIYEAIDGLVAKGELADAIVLKNRLAGVDALSEIGGVEYLALLLEQAPPVATALEYAKLIADMAIRREGLVAAEALAGDLSDLNGPKAKETLSKTTEALTALSLRGVGQSSFVLPADVAVDLLNMEAPEQIPTGLKTLDSMFKLDRQAITLLAGHTSMGKSAVAMEFARRAAANGYRVDLFSLEMNKWQVTSRLISATMAEGSEPRNPRGLPYFKISRPNELDDLAKDYIRETIPSLPPVNIDATPGLTVSDMIARLSENEAPPDLVIVDYVNIVGLSDMDNRLRHDQQIGDIAARLRNLAKTRNCAVVLLCQLNRNSVSRDQKAPELSDLKDSSALEQAADTVLFCHRPEYFLEREVARVQAANETPDVDLLSDLASARNKLFIICAKQRMGPTGQRELLAHIKFNYITEGPNK